jgi:hypothetical protein
MVSCAALMVCLFPSFAQTLPFAQPLPFLAQASPQRNHSNSLDWQIRQLFGQMGEGFERWISGQKPSEPPDTPSLPPLDPWWWPPLEFWRAVFWLIIALLALWVLWMLWQAIDSNWRGYREGRLNRERGDRTPEVAVNPNRWAKQAQILARQGNYSEACRALYFATLDQLHELRWVPRKDSRTDGEYDTSVQRIAPQLSPRTAQAVQTLLLTHEQITFSNRPIDSENFAQCQQAYGQVSGLQAKPGEGKPHKTRGARKPRRWL